MNISVFGLGYVGCVSMGCLARNGHNVVGVDVNAAKVDQINQGIATIVEADIDGIIREERQKGAIRATGDVHEAVLSTELSIIAVGTPSSATGHLDLSHVLGLAESIGYALKAKGARHTVALRSTVLPGTCDRFAALLEEFSGKARNVDFAVVSNPEFLREGTAVKDYYNPPLTLIGAENVDAARLVASVYEKIPGEKVVTGTRVAEMMKYVNNTFHALKICFANEIGNICAELKIDSHEVMDILCKDKQLNISPYYLRPGFAYGGSCLPKDLKGLQMLAHDLYVKVPLIDSIQQSNDQQVRRAIDMILRQGKKRLGFLGLSFKEGTDDLRNSPAVMVVEAILGKGYDVQIYDRNVQASRLLGANKEFVGAKIPHLWRLMVDDAKAMVGQSEVIVVSNRDPVFSELLSGCSGKTIIDLVRLSDDVRATTGYMGINW